MFPYSIPSGYAHAQQEAGTIKQIIASRSGLTLGEVRSALALQSGSRSSVPSRILTFSHTISTQIGLYVGFVAEIYAWFCVGEIVGRGGSISGYKV